MKVQHTPGPWKYEADTDSSPWTIRSVKENYWIATMDSWDGAVDNLANARLIAAAPEMLEALKASLEMLRVYRPHDKYPDRSVKPGDSEIVSRLKAVIAKAESEAESA
jgi:hypothetical protein